MATKAGPKGRASFSPRICLDYQLACGEKVRVPLAPNLYTGAVSVFSSRKAESCSGRRDYFTEPDIVLCQISKVFLAQRSQENFLD